MLAYIELSSFRRSVWPSLSALGFAYHYAFAAETWIKNHAAADLGAENAWTIRVVICLLMEARERGHVCLPLSEISALWKERQLDAVAHNHFRSALEISLNSSPPELAQIFLDSGIAQNEENELARTAALSLRNDSAGWWLYVASDATTESVLSNEIRALNGSLPDNHTWPETTENTVEQQRQWFSTLPPGLAPSAEQQSAVFAALDARIFILSGGPGTGKTSTVFHMLRALCRQSLSRTDTLPTIALAAPTGRAAARMQESLAASLEKLNPWLVDSLDQHFVSMLSGLAGATLHRLLGISGSFRQEPSQVPLPFDLVVVDEASMVDQYLMQRLVSRIGPQTSLILVGDHNQLPSVESGAVLAELIALNPLTGRSAIPSVRLTTFFRSRRGILDCSLAVLEGRPEKVLGPHSSPFADVSVLTLAQDSAGFQHLDRLLEFWIRDNRLAEVCQACTVIDPKHVETTLPELFETAQAQVILTPFHGSRFGVEALNTVLGEKLRATLGRTSGKAQKWFPGMVVMASKNDYERGLYNGDRGLVYSENATLRVWFPGSDKNGRIHPSPSSIPGLIPAFAMTIHKSQGSEFDTVLLFVGENGSKEGHVCRELLYTGMTRSRSSLTLAADAVAFEEACGRSARRWTRLSDRLGVSTL